MIPPLKTSTPCSRENVAIVFAARTGSPLIRVSAVGPSSSPSRPSVPVCSTARLARRFLTTLNAASPSESLTRSSLAWGTLMPR